MNQEKMKEEDFIHNTLIQEIQPTDKYALGVLIGYYSTIFLDDTKTYYIANNEFIKNEDGSNISSIQTFTNLKRGLFIKNDEIYFDFMDKLQTQYPFFSYANHSEVIKTIRRFTKTMKQEMERYDRNKIVAVAIDAQKILEPYQSNIIPYEYYTAFTIIQRYYEDGVLMDGNTIDKYISTIDVFDGDMKQCLKHLLFVSQSKRTKDDSALIQLFYRMRMDQDEMFNLRYNHCFVQVLENNQIDALSAGNQLILECQESQNYEALLRVYQLKKVIVNNVQKGQVAIVQNQIDDLINEHQDKLDRNTLANFHYNKAILEYRNRNYPVALHHFEHVVGHSPQKLLPSAIYACHIANQLQLPLQSKFIVAPEEITFVSEIEEILYTYYYMQFTGVASEELRNYLFKHYRTIKQSNAKFYIAITNYELRDRLGLSSRLRKKLNI